MHPESSRGDWFDQELFACFLQQIIISSLQLQMQDRQMEDSTLEIQCLKRHRVFPKTFYEVSQERFGCTILFALCFYI